MKLKFQLLLSASVLLVATHGAAFAQSSPAAPAQADNAQADADQDPEAIVVKGYRASLRSAQQIKRRSDAILDAVVAEDIGKLPDNNASESLARLPGIQISRGSDEGSGVLVRGLPDVATTVNGRDISTAELRRVQLQDFPSGALAGMEVYKSATADLLDPGLAGLVNVRTRRPFDFKGFEVHGAIRETYNDQNGKFNTNGNILFTDRWSTNLGEFGALLNLSYTEQTYRNAVRWADGWITQPDNGVVVQPSSVGNSFWFPGAIGVYNDSGHRWRPSANATLQWRVNDNVELYADLLWQAYRATHENDWGRVPLKEGAPTLSNVVLQDGTDMALSFTKTGGNRPEFYRSTSADRTDTQQIAVGGSYTNGRLKFSTDVAYTNSLYANDSWSLDSALKTAPVVEVNFETDGGVAFSAPGLDVSDPANYIWRGYYESVYKVGGNGIQLRGDVVFDADWGIVKTIKAGLRFTDRNAFLRRNDRYAWTMPLEIALSSVPAGELSLTQDTFRGDAQGFRNWLMPSREGIVDNRADLLDFTRTALQQLVALNPTDQGWKNTLAAFQPEVTPYNPLRGFKAREETRTGYAQAHYDSTLFNVPVDGDVGVRVVNTFGHYSGISSVTWNGITESLPRNITQDYTDVLPNVSMRLRPTDQIQLRLAVTKTRTRPDFGQLNPALSISQYVPTGTPDPEAADAYGSAGNPDLKPLTSTNYDATFEYYFSGNGSASVAVFYRDLFGFISNYTRRVQDPVYGEIEVSRPENAGEGKIKGIEVSGQTFFDFLPGAWSGLGVQANVTYIDAYNRLPATLAVGATPPPFVKIPGVSNWSYNFALFYEKDKISTRLSLNGRSRWINWYDDSRRIGAFTGEGTESVQRLDYSLNYSPNDNVTINFDVSNILAEPFHNFREFQPGKQFTRDIRDEGRYYGLSLRFKYN